MHYVQVARQDSARRPRINIFMNVFDFDKTIYDGDSTQRFLIFLIRRYPRLLLKLPGFGVNALLFGLKLRKKQDFKERMFKAFFAGVPDIHARLEEFWDQNMGGVKKWYKTVRREDDLVITASPVDIVRPCCERLGIKRVMGSPVDMSTGRYTGPNCHGDEKVRRFFAEFPGKTVDDFYSDSHSDDPMARLAKKAVMVKGEELLPWIFK